MFILMIKKKIKYLLSQYIYYHNFEELKVII